MLFENKYTTELYSVPGVGAIFALCVQTTFSDFDSMVLSVMLTATAVNMVELVKKRLKWFSFEM